MIGYLRGKIIQARYGKLILDVAGVGYTVNVIPDIAIPENCVDASCLLELYIHEHIREDAYDLYGFVEPYQLEMFEKLISVSGVGPKAAINIMSVADTKKIATAIEGSDLSFFTAVPGIGKKVAAKIILELKSKMTASDNESVLLESDSSNEVVEAMASLGYKKSDVSKYIAQIPSDILKTEEKVRWLLKNFKK